VWGPTIRHPLQAPAKRGILTHCPYRYALAFIAGPLLARAIVEAYSRMLQHRISILTTLKCQLSHAVFLPSCRAGGLGGGGPADKAAQKCNMVFLYQRFAYMAWQADSEEAGPLLEELNIEVLPTVQFWKAGQLLWEHRGIVALQQDLGEGAAFHFVLA